MLMKVCDGQESDGGRKRFLPRASGWLREIKKWRKEKYVTSMRSQGKDCCPWEVVKKCQRLLQVTHEGMIIVMIPVLSNFSFPLSCPNNSLPIFRFSVAWILCHVDHFLSVVLNSHEIHFHPSLLKIFHRFIPDFSSGVVFRINE